MNAASVLLLVVSSWGGVPPSSVRTVDAVLADVVNALGGEAALGRHKSLHVTMELEFQGLGIKGTAERYAAEGDRSVTITTIPDLATTREGSDGKRIWSEDPINGLRILSGAEAEQARLDATWNVETKLGKLFKKIEVVNETGEDGRPQECLVMTPKVKGASAITECFDADSHLLVVQRGSRAGPQGEVPFVAKTGDWRQLGDLKLPYLTEMQAGPLTFVGRITAAELDVPVKPDMFAVPKVQKGKAGGGGGAHATGKAAAPAPAAAP